MALSKPIYSLLGNYFYYLHNHPIKTKSITSCMIATLGNLSAQFIAGNKPINQDSLIAFALYGLFFGGPVPHFFYKVLAKVIPEDSSSLVIKQLLVERLIFAPLNQILALYMISRLEGKTHQQAMVHLLQLFWPFLKANWIYLTVLQYLNLRYVPPMLRVLVVNIIGFFWVIYLARKRQQAREKQSRKK